MVRPELTTRVYCRLTISWWNLSCSAVELVLARRSVFRSDSLTKLYDGCISEPPAKPVNFSALRSPNQPALKNVDCERLPEWWRYPSVSFPEPRTYAANVPGP